MGDGRSRDVLVSKQELAGKENKMLDSDELVKQYLPLLRRIAKRYSRVSPESFEDLMQVGCVGLLKAIKYYDLDRENRASFKTFALCYIKGEIRHYLRDCSSLVQVPRRLNEISSRIRHLEESLTQELEHTPTAAELAKHSGYSVDDVRQAQQSWEACSHYENLDSPDDADAETRPLSEMVADRKHLEQVHLSEEQEVLAQAMVHLGDRTRQIVEFVFFYDLTQKETARLLGVSEMGVSRAVKSGLKKLKEILFTEVL
jgi:RNA polymerase sigma-B factor